MAKIMQTGVMKVTFKLPSATYLMQKYKLNLRSSLLWEEYFGSWSNLTPHYHL